MVYLVGYEKVKRDRGGGPVKEVVYVDVKGLCRSKEDAENFRKMLQDGEMDHKAVVEIVE